MRIIGQGLFPENHSCFIGTYWGNTLSSMHVEEIVELSDLIILAGVKCTDVNTAGWTVPDLSHKCITMHARSVSIGDKRYHNICIDDILSTLAIRAQKKEATMVEFHRLSAENIATTKFDDDDELCAGTVAPILQSIVDTDTSIVVDTGDSWFVGQALKLPNGAKYYSQMLYGSVGWAIPAALGIGMGTADENSNLDYSGKVLLILGDGACQMSIQEISTIIHQGMRTVIILLNNIGYAIHEQVEDKVYNKVNNWEYTQIVKSFIKSKVCSHTVRATQVQTPAELQQSLNMVALNEEQNYSVHFIECVLQPGNCTLDGAIWARLMARKHKGHCDNKPMDF